MLLRRASAALAAAAVAAAVAGTVPAATPENGAVTPSNPTARWTGGHLIGGAPNPGDCATVPTACDEFSLAINVPPWHWRTHPGGVVVRIEWPNKDDILNLFVYNAKGRAVAGSNQTNQFGAGRVQVFLAAPAPGTYRVLVQGFAVVDATYSGEARIVEQDVPLARTERNTIRFAPPTLVDPQIFAPEPSVEVSRTGTVYVSAPWSPGGASSSLIWRSDDGGRTFIPLIHHEGALANPVRGPCATSGLGGGDAAVVTDRTGRVYFADLEAFNLATGYSTDRGKTWSCNELGASTLDPDRPWFAASPTADGEGPNVDAYLAYKDLIVGQLPGGRLVKPTQIHVDVTSNGGKSWVPEATYAQGLVVQSGPIFAASDGTIYQVFEGNDNAVWIARSTDQGESFPTQVKVSQRLGQPGNIFLSGAVDAAGNVYAAWVDGGTFDVLYSFSSDRGEHWSAPRRVNPPNSTATMPWIAAGAPGDIAISWYGTTGDFRPDDAAPSTAWRPWVARSLRGASSTARFQLSPMSQLPTHLGPLCTESGATCGRLLDYFTIAIAPDGAIIGTFNDNARVWEPSAGDAGDAPGPYTVVARQTSGLGMKSISRAGGEGRGEVDQEPELDFTSSPTATWASNKVRMSFTLGSTRTLSALPASTAPASTDAYWILTWKAGARTEYAGMHVDPSGAIDFFGGDRPVGVVRNTASWEVYASYPPTFQLQGSIDTARGLVTIDLPAALYHLKLGDQLMGLQAFSFTGTPTRTAYTPLDVVDSTAASVVRLQVLPARERRQAVRPTKREGILPGTGVGGDLVTWPVLGTALALAWWLFSSSRTCARRQSRSSRRPTAR